MHACAFQKENEDAEAFLHSFKCGVLSTVWNYLIKEWPHFIQEKYGNKNLLWHPQWSKPYNQQKKWNLSSSEDEEEVDMVTGYERKDGTDNIIEVRVSFRPIVQEQEYFREQEETKGRTL